MNTTTEILSVNGIVLNTLAKNVETIAGRLHAAGKRTANVVVPGKHGELWVPGKLSDANEVVLPMWVRGCDDDGLIPGGGSARAQFFANLDQLVRVFAKTTSLNNLPPLDVRHTLPDGTIRQCFAEVLEEIDFTVIGPNPLGKYSVTLHVPEGFWQDVAVTTQNIVTGLASPVTLTFNLLAGSTAPIWDSVITVTGPLNAGWMLADAESGETLTINNALAAGQTVVIDNANWTVTQGANDWLTATTHTGDVFLPLHPDDTGALKITVTGAGMTAATAVQVAARRKFRTG